MKVSDIMTVKVITVAPDVAVGAVAARLAENHLSALPVVDERMHVLGIVSEGDLMRRREIGTQRETSWWLQLFTAPDQAAAQFIKAHGLAAKDVMSRPAATIGPDASIAEAAELMERIGVKRLPVTRNQVLAGIIARADLVRTLAAAPPLQAGAHDDTAIRMALEAALDGERWTHAAELYVTVLEHTAHLWGRVESRTLADAVEVLARGVPGVRDVKNHLTIE